MKLNFTLIITFLLFFSYSRAQQKINVTENGKRPQTVSAKHAVLQAATPRPLMANGRPEKCGFAMMMEQAKANGFDNAAYEAALKPLIQKRLALNQGAFTGTVTLPVIFHVLYRTTDSTNQASGTAYLPVAQINAQIAQMNKDYANLSSSSWPSVAANVRIQFCAALVDTAGRVLAQPGVHRVNTQTKGWANSNTQGSPTALQTLLNGTIKPNTIWDPYSFFNVWTCGMDASGLLGFSTFPSFSTLPGLDNGETSLTAGTVISWQSVGSVTSPGVDPDYGFGRTLTHESGHFFGLRHIDGDDVCGDDFCADTPPQDALTSGCPAVGTFNNCTPAGPKMFQNYMDYSDDACLNTFTANQATRMQTVMDNSPRRFTLMNSKACVARPSNAIQFDKGAILSASETGNAGTCPNSKSYAFKLHVSAAATGAATVTFTGASGTATNNADFSFSPASVTYTNGDAADKTITITIIDDQIVEPDENLILGYTISGTGVVAGPEKQTLTITITDNDVANIAVNNTTPIKTILSQNFDGSTAGWTTEVLDDGIGGYTPNQWIYGANGGAGTTGNSAYVTQDLASAPNTYDNTLISDAYLYSPLIDATGLRDLNLSFKWRCLGETNYDEGYLGYIPEGTPLNPANVLYFNTAFRGFSAIQTASLNFAPSFGNNRFYLVFNWFNDETVGTSPAFTIDDIVVTGKQFAVATTIDADTAFSQFNGQTVSYYSKPTTGTPTNRIIATVSNLNQDLGCINASIPYAGTGKTTLLTQSGSFFRTDKVIKLTPATANTTATFQGTLYYTTAELATAWTAGEIPNLKILKVKEGADIFGTLTSADAVLVTPTFVNNSASAGYYSYTGNFTGFSQFMLVSPNTVIPVKLLNFDVKALRKSIQLNWSTATEVNNKGFKIERSTDGVMFNEIGWQSGKINSSSKTNYTFYDNFVKSNTNYYYRLRQVDLDGREDNSSIRSARIDKAVVNVTVSPVPTKDVLNVFISGTNKTADIQLFNVDGQLVRTFKNASGSSILNVSGLSSGVYMLNIQLAEEKIVRKILIER